MKKKKESCLERRCISSMEVRQTRTMIRFVLSPDNVVTPDLKNALPGRGMWVTSCRSALQNAVDKNMFSKSAKAKVFVPDDLIERTEMLLRKRIIESVSLARRSGQAISGFEKVKELLKSHQADVILCAGDTKADSAEKLAGMCRMLEVSFFGGVEPLELGKVFGNDKATYAGIVKCGIADTLKYEIDRLNLFLAGEKQ